MTEEILNNINTQKEIDQQEIDRQEIEQALKPDGILTKPENIQKIKEELKNIEKSELLSSLENSLNNAIDQILSQAEISESDILILDLWDKLLGEGDGDKKNKLIDDLLNKKTNLLTSKDLQLISFLIKSLGENNIETKDKLQKHKHKGKLSLLQDVLINIENQEKENSLDPIKNLQELGVDTTQKLGREYIFKLNGLSRNIDLINETNIKECLGKAYSDKINSKNIQYIVNNFKIFMLEYFVVFPNYKSANEEGNGFQTGRSMEKHKEDMDYWIKRSEMIVNMIQNNRWFAESTDFSSEDNQNRLFLYIQGLCEKYSNDNVGLTNKLVELFDKWPQNSKAEDSLISLINNPKTNNILKRLAKQYIYIKTEKFLETDKNGNKIKILDSKKESKWSRFYKKGNSEVDEWIEKTRDFYNNLQENYNLDNSISFDKLFEFNEKGAQLLEQIEEINKTYKKEMESIPPIKYQGEILEKEAERFGSAVAKSSAKRSEGIKKVFHSFEVEYVKTMLMKNPLPTGKTTLFSGFSINFDKYNKNKPLEENIDNIIRNTVGERLSDWISKPENIGKLAAVTAATIAGAALVATGIGSGPGVALISGTFSAMGMGATAATITAGVASVAFAGATITLASKSGGFLGQSIATGIQDKSISSAWEGGLKGLGYKNKDGTINENFNKELFKDVLINAGAYVVAGAIAHGKNSIGNILHKIEHSGGKFAFGFSENVLKNSVKYGIYGLSYLGAKESINVLVNIFNFQNHESNIRFESNNNTKNNSQEKISEITSLFGNIVIDAKISETVNICKYLGIDVTELKNIQEKRENIKKQISNEISKNKVGISLDESGNPIFTIKKIIAGKEVIEEIKADDERINNISQLIRQLDETIDVSILEKYEKRVQPLIDDPINPKGIAIKYDLKDEFLPPNKIAENRIKKIDELLEKETNSDSINNLIIMKEELEQVRKFLD